MEDDELRKEPNAQAHYVVDHGADVGAVDVVRGRGVCGSVLRSGQQRRGPE